MNGRIYITENEETESYKIHFDVVLNGLEPENNATLQLRRVEFSKKLL